MRLIDADDEKLQGTLKLINEAEIQIYGPNRWRFAGQCIDAIEKAPTVEVKPTWIPCSEALPEMHEAGPMMQKLGRKEESEKVNISVRIKKSDLVVDGWLIDGKWFIPNLIMYDVNKVDYEVTAWMPLPKPYIESGEGVSKNQDRPD